MLKIYGSVLCPDCIRCREDLDRAGVAYEYHDFGDDLPALKAFLRIRDSEPLYAAVKAEGKIGIPCIVDENGAISLNWEQYL